MKIISYCLYGNEQYYKNGLLKNIVLAKQLFPDWIVRIYYEKFSIDQNYLDAIQKFDNIKLIEKVQRFSNDGIHWRMLPLEEDHDFVIIRDVDTRLSQRDLDLVNDWIKLPYQYHICRDEPGHKAPIMAGIWGAKKAKLPISRLWNKHYLFLNFNLNEDWAGRGNDQEFLSKRIYPIIRKNSAVYSEFNIFFGEEVIRKIPNKITINEEGLYDAIGTRRHSDLVASDINIIGNKNKIRAAESGINAAKWFNERYEKSHIKINFPRYFFKSIIASNLIWVVYILYTHGPKYFFNKIYKYIIIKFNR